MKLGAYIARRLGISREELRKALYLASEAINIARHLLEAGAITIPNRPRTFKAAYNLLWTLKDKIEREELEG